MTLIDDLKTDLIRDEGYRHVPYKDSKGNWTCGIGHLMGREPFKGEYWSDSHIEGVFKADIREILIEIQNKPWYSELNINRQRAILNMTFNLGIKGLEGFHTFLSLLVSKRFTEAADDLKETLWAREVGQRAVRIEALIRTG